MKEIEEYMKINFESQMENMLHNLIKYLRAEQDNFMNGDGAISGERRLKEMFDQGILNMDQVMAINPAVIHYEKPYILNIKN